MQIHCPHDRLVAVHELKPHPKNRNQHPKDQIERLAKILDYQGWRYPIKVSKRSGFITSGHGRLEAAKHLKLKEVPVSFQDYTDEAQEYADLQADNAIASWSELDLSAINSDIADLGPDFDIDLLGINGFVIEPADKLDPQCDEDEVPDALPEPKVVRGEVYILGKHRLMCGDSTAITDVERLMDGKKAGMLHTDPPYNISMRRSESIQNDDLSADEFKDLLSDTIANAAMVTEDGANWLVWIGWRAFGVAQSICERYRKVRNCITWVKPSIGLGQPGFRYRHELGVFCGEIESRSESDVWEFGRDRQGLHPTMKPVELVEYALTKCCKDRSYVLDLFGGSGSTLIACEKTGRTCFMMEIDPHYCGVILDRWQKYTGKKAYREDGKLWDEIKAQ